MVPSGRCPQPGPLFGASFGGARHTRGRSSRSFCYLFYSGEPGAPRSVRGGLPRISAPVAKKPRTSVACAGAAPYPPPERHDQTSRHKTRCKSCLCFAASFSPPVKCGKGTKRPTFWVTAHCLNSSPQLAQASGGYASGLTARCIWQQVVGYLCRDLSRSFTQSIRAAATAPRVPSFVTHPLVFS